MWSGLTHGLTNRRRQRAMKTHALSELADNFSDSASAGDLLRLHDTALSIEEKLAARMLLQTERSADPYQMAHGD